MSALSPRPFVRAVWEGLIALGRLQATGQVRIDGRPGPDPMWDAPPPGHPDRMRPDLPLTPLERRLRREMRRGPA